MKKLILLLALFIGLMLNQSCIDDDGNPATPITLCNDVKYYGLRSDGMDNTSQTIEVVSNSSSNITNTTLNALTSFSYANEVANNSATYDEVSNQMVFLDEWNAQHQLIVYNLTGNTVTTTSIASSNFISAPVFLNGKLYVLEFENYPGNNVYLKEVTNLNTGTLSLAILTFPLSTFNMNPDTMSNKAFGTSNGVNTLYFLGDKLMEVNLGAFSFSFKNLPSTDRYLDIVSIESGELVTARNNGAGQRDLVKWDVSSTNIIETTLISNINFNPESVALVYKECADRLHLLTHFSFNGSGVNSTVLEINLITNNLISQTFPGWIFGIVHKTL